MECPDADMCPGGEPDSCAPHHQDLLCSECQDGYTMSSQNECKTCTPGKQMLMPAMLVLGVIILAVLYQVCSSPEAELLRKGYAVLFFPLARLRT